MHIPTYFTAFEIKVGIFTYWTGILFFINFLTYCKEPSFWDNPAYADSGQVHVLYFSRLFSALLELVLRTFFFFQAIVSFSLLLFVGVQSVNCVFLLQFCSREINS